MGNFEECSLSSSVVSPAGEKVTLTTAKSEFPSISNDGNKSKTTGKSVKSRKNICF